MYGKKQRVSKRDKLNIKENPMTSKLMLESSLTASASMSQDPTNIASISRLYKPQAGLCV